MYKTFKITEYFLYDHGACSDGVEEFNKLFPNGVTISNSQEEMIDLLLEYEGELSNLSWLVRRLVNGHYDKYYLGATPCYKSGSGLEMEVHYSDLPTIGVLISDSKYLK